MEPRLTQISIKDFRSIRGEVTIPLDAPIVLVHGPNGAGKTSLMSALELALTGEVGALRRSDEDVHRHLTNRYADSSRIKLSVDGISTSSTQFTIADGEVSGKALLPIASAQFFTERCYLSQSTLSRLLDIYQNPTSREQAVTPLTRFVKDLLGLDQLEAIIDGLRSAGHKGRLAKLAPDLGRAETLQLELQKELKLLSDERSVDETNLAALQPKLQKISSALGISGGKSDEEFDRVLRIDQEELQLTQLIGWRRELLSLKRGWEELPGENQADERVRIESAEASSATLLERFNGGPGTVLSQLISELRKFFPDLPDPVQVDPQTAWKTAHDQTKRELARCQAELSKTQAAAERLATSEQRSRQLQSKLQTLEEQLKGFSGDAADFGRALSGILPHIHGVDCPVCGRNYNEISPEPLEVHVTSLISRAVSAAERLKSFSKERTETLSILSSVERDRSALAGQMLTKDSQIELQQRAASLQKAQVQLQQIEGAAEEGARVRREYAEASGAAASLRLREVRSAEIRQVLTTICKTMNQPGPKDTETTPTALIRLITFTEEKNRELQIRQENRRDAIGMSALIKQLRDAELKRQDLVHQKSARLERIKNALKDAATVRQDARTVSRAAEKTRQLVVSQVFNERLNEIWQNLFVRLAPTEPFVPAFTSPENEKSPIEARLETVDREGIRYGRPGSMLSAGNLNTAALTLFIALHLAVHPKLPWLFLDDPVQSMDELHIAQFAALLRTLARDQERQIIIAVHERPLFDYLALELSPAYAEDKLITIELSRSANETTEYTPTILAFEPDRLIA